tara:strand:- start:474 stop:800 length:327 start_codon:yes stop_codon:yes gene_type:complete
MNKLNNELKFIFKLVFLQSFVFGVLFYLIQFVLIQNNLFNQNLYEIFNFIGFLSFFFPIYIFTKLIKLLKIIEKEKRIIITGLLFLSAQGPIELVMRKSANFLFSGGN